MWILEFLPNWIFYSLLVLGVLGYCATYLLRFVPIPAVYMYKTPIQFISVALIVFGTYMIGAISNNDAWLTKVKEMEVKVAEAEAKAAQENIKIVEKVVTKTNVVKEKGQDIVKYIDREIVKYDSKCEIPKEAVKALNDAAVIKDNKK